MSLFTARAAAIVLAECCSEHRILQRLKLWCFQRLAECGSLYVLTSCTACKGGVKLNALVQEWRSSATIWTPPACRLADEAASHRLPYQQRLASHSHGNAAWDEHIRGTLCP
jgi:hypothetical protein